MGKLYHSPCSISYTLNLLKKGREEGAREGERTKRRFNLLVNRAVSMSLLKLLFYYDADVQ